MPLLVLPLNGCAHWRKIQGPCQYFWAILVAMGCGGAPSLGAALNRIVHSAWWGSGFGGEVFVCGMLAEQSVNAGHTNIQAGDLSHVDTSHLYLTSLTTGHSALRMQRHQRCNSITTSQCFLSNACRPQRPRCCMANMCIEPDAWHAHHNPRVCIPRAIQAGRFKHRALDLCPHASENRI